MRRLLLAGFAFLLFVSAAYAQQARVDSLTEVLKPYESGKKYDQTYVKVLLQLSSALEKIEPSKGVEVTKRAIELSRSLRLPFYEARGNNQLGLQLRDLGKWDEARKCFDKARSIAAANQICIEEGNAVNNIAVIYQRLGKLDECLAIHKEAQQIRLKCNDQAGLIGTYVNMGIVNRKQGYLDVAMKYYLLALEMIDKVSDKTSLPNIYNNIGNIETEQGKYREAISWYQKAVDIYSKQGLTERLARTLGNIADAYRSIGDTVNSNISLRKSADWFFSIPYPAAQIYGNKNLGMLYENLRMPDSSIYYFEKSFDQGRRLNDLETMINALHSMAAVALRYGMAEKALHFADTSLAIVDQSKARLYKYQSLKIRTEALYALGRFREAYDTYQNYVELRDSVFSADRSQRIAELEVQYKAQLTERENSLLKKQQELDHSELEYKSSQLELIEKERRLQELELLSRERAMQLHQENAVRDKQRIQLLEKDRNFRNIQLEKEKWLSSLWLTGVLGLGLITFLLIILQRIRKRSLQQQRDKNVELERASIEIGNQQRALREQNERLALLNNEKNEILAVAAHDLKNPIGSVLGLAQLIVNPATPEEARRECIAQIQFSSRKMLHLVTNLLDVEKIETGKHELLYTSVNLRDVLSQALNHNAWTAKEKRINLRLEDDDAPEEMVTDFSVFTQIIDNLISNALKFSPYESSVVVRAQKRSSDVVIAITDNGPGLSEEDKAHLFSKFSRLSARPTGTETSTGLGLYIVKRLVTELHGSIRCESEPGKGSSFIVELPLKIETAVTA